MKATHQTQELFTPPPKMKQEYKSQIAKELPLPPFIQEIVQKIQLAGGRAYLVGGWVRDMLAREIDILPKHISPKDFDLEVFGLNETQLQQALTDYPISQKIGQTFGIYKISSPENNLDIDIALARTETKTGHRHQDFQIEISPNLTPRQTSQRRDFTINALMYDPISRQILDFHQGIKDLNQKIIRLIDPEAFQEDPLRVYRAASLASRLGFASIRHDRASRQINIQPHIDPQTLQLCQKMVARGDLDEFHLTNKQNELQRDQRARAAIEWHKILTKSLRFPSIGLTYLDEFGILEKYFPEINALKHTPQDRYYHPEGNVFTHTLIALDYALNFMRQAKISPKNQLMLMLAVLCHDIGKPATTHQWGNHRISHQGHDQKKYIQEPISHLLAKLPFHNQQQTKLKEKILKLVAEHMHIHRLIDRIKAGEDRSKTDRTLMRLTKRLAPATIQELVILAKADHFATGSNRSSADHTQLVLEQAKRLNIQNKPPKPLLDGREIMQLLNLNPGPKVGQIKTALYEAYLDQKIKTRAEARQWLIEKFSASSQQS